MEKGPEFQGYTAANQHVLREQNRQRKRGKRVRAGLLALSFLAPAGGIGIVAANRPDSGQAFISSIGPRTSESTTGSPPSTTVFESPQVKTEQTTTTLKKSVPTPSNFGLIYQSAGAKFNIPPEILYGLHKTESDCAGDGALMNMEGSGAQGPMQFMPATWRRYGVDGDGDGDADIDSAADAIFGAANLLSGYQSIEEGLEAYGANVAGVLEHARSRGYK